MFSPIHHTFGPLADSAQVREALRRLARPAKMKRGEATDQLRSELGKAFAADCFLFSSGREALLALLEALEIKPGDEIILQGYTCMVLGNAIHAAGALPIYVDIERDTLNVDLDDLRNAITPKTRAVICQHTFGIPADTSGLRAICDEHALALIEDCAHIIPDRSGPEEIGVNGDFLMFSFGRDKAISGVLGGALLCKHSMISSKLRIAEESAEDLSTGVIVRSLLYPILYWIGRPFYGILLGKALIVLSGRMGLLLPILSGEEKDGMMKKTIHRLPNANAALALEQWKKLRTLNDHRRMLGRYYLKKCRERGWDTLGKIRDDLPLQKFPLFIAGANALRAELKKRNIYLDDGWTGCVICPESAHSFAAGYIPGTDPKAEEACERIVSLPTHPTMTLKQAKRLMTILEKLMTRS